MMDPEQLVRKARAIADLATIFGYPPKRAILERAMWVVAHDRALTGRMIYENYPTLRFRKDGH